MAREGLKGYILELFLSENLFEALPGELQADLLATREQVLLHQKWLCSEVKRLATAFRERIPGARIVLLKGISLLKSFYAGREYVRRISDVDIWVPGKTIGALCTVIQDLGYIKDQHYDNHFTFQNISLDIHRLLISNWRVAARKKMFKGLEDEFIKNIQPSGGFSFFYELCPRDQARYLFIHYTLHHGCKPARWGLEILELLTRNPGILSLADERRTDLKRLYGMVEFLLGERWGFFPALRPANPSPPLKFLLKYVDRWLPAQEEVRYLYAFFFMPGLLSKINYSGEIFFPKKKALLALYPDAGRTPLVLLWLRFWMDQVRKILG